MKTLQTIQTISKIAQIVSKIIFICCIVGFCMCVAGIVSVAAGVSAIRIGGVTLDSILETKGDMTTGSLYAAMASGAIVCAGEGILAKFASRYFAREQADGTPFTTDGAKELMRLGILSIGIPVGMQAAVQIVQKVLVKIFTDVEPSQSDPAVSLTVGALVLMLALLCKYGAEMTEEKTTVEN